MLSTHLNPSLISAPNCWPRNPNTLFEINHYLKVLHWRMFPYITLDISKDGPSKSLQSTWRLTIHEIHWKYLITVHVWGNIIPVVYSYDRKKTVISGKVSGLNERWGTSCLLQILFPFFPGYQLLARSTDIFFILQARSKRQIYPTLLR